jgi:hypothetical protein
MSPLGREKGKEVSVETKSDSAELALIERTTPRAVFAELVASALWETRVQPSPMAIAYLIELLDSRVHTAAPAADGTADEATLAEDLLEARLQAGIARLRRLRNLGDRALFVAGFFGDSLSRSVVDIDYYGDVGRAAYANLAESLARQVTEKTWTGLYLELAQRFHEFVDVLAEVGDRTRSGGSEDLLRLYERYLRTGSPRDRSRLARRGHVPPDRRALRFWQ